MPVPYRRAVIITALPLERKAVLEHLQDIHEEPPLRGSVYRKGIFNERSEPWEVVVAEIGAGNEGAAAEADRVIGHYVPQVALFVGIAGAIKDLEHGDVVASTKVYGYESGKDVQEGFVARPSVELPAYGLLQRARHEAGDEGWHQRIKGASHSTAGSNPSAQVGPIAAGEKVLASNRSAIYSFIRNSYGDAVAVEMEGHGFLLGVRMNHPAQGIVIRGISDKIRNKKPAGDKKWQPIAARNAAAFAFQVLAKFVGEINDDKNETESRINEAWQAQHLEDARRTAGPRYSAKLQVGTPLHTVFESLCQTDVWFESIRPLGRKLREASRHWSDNVRTTKSGGWGTEFPKHLRDSGEAISQHLAGIEHIFSALMHSKKKSSPRDVAAAAGAALPLLRELHLELREDLDSRHGEGSADSAHFRQFEAEYQASFPAANVDAARDLVAQLEELEAWGLSEQGRAAGACGLLLMGAAGAGKTHAICDIAHDRLQRGLYTVIVFGEHFAETDEPWDKLGRLLGFGTRTRDELLMALDAAGKSSVGPLLLCVDGLNESKPRAYWRSRLSSFVAQASRLSNIRICVSCRSTYEPIVIPDGHGLERVEHNGFVGIENTACRAFFAHYGLEPPVGPSFHPGFSNPLFLRLVCETLKAAGLKQMPTGWRGVNTALKALLAEKNKAFAQEFERNVRERVPQRALDEFMVEAERARRVLVPWHDASAAVNRVQPPGLVGPSILDWLVREGLLIADVTPTEGPNDAEDVVRVAFERLGEHLLAARLLSQVQPGEFEEAIQTGPLRFAFSSEDAVLANRGLVEALAIQLPEHTQWRCELLDVLPPEAPHESIISATVAMLPWRDPEYMTERTREIAYQSLTTSRKGFETFDVLLSVGCQEHPMDAIWLHRQLLHMSMPHRDAFLCPYFHERMTGSGVVEHLLCSAHHTDVASIPEAILLRWAVLLLWFCVSADRRVRDRATRGLVAITESRPHVWATLVRLFSASNDEYVVERCFCAAYGSLLRTRDREAERVVAIAVHKAVFNDSSVFQNALIRDYARCIVELAAMDEVLDPSIDITTVRPPYKSDWPLVIPSNKKLTQYKNSQKEHPGLYQSCMDGDFSHYLLSRLGSYEHVIKRSDMGRWVLNHVVQDLGYSGRVLESYDGYMRYKYGGGRGRPGWAERIGKKYQWISLSRLAARLTDNLEPARDAWSREPIGIPLTYQDGRDFDPSLLNNISDRSTNIAARGTSGSRWWLPMDYDFKSKASISHNEWATEIEDVPRSSEVLAPLTDPNGREWQLLEIYPTWDSRPRHEDREYPYRQLWMHIRGYLVAKKSARKVFQWLSKQNFMGRWMQEGRSFDEGFIGEYPWGIPFVRDEDDYMDKYSRRRCPARITPVCNTISSSHSEDASQTEGVTLHVPSSTFFQDEPLLRWDGVAGFGLRGEPTRFLDPSPNTRKHPALLVDRTYLLDYLKRTDQCLVWAVLGEKLIITGSVGTFDRLTFNQAHLMDGDGHLISSALSANAELIPFTLEAWVALEIGFRVQNAPPRWQRPLQRE